LKTLSQFAVYLKAGLRYQRMRKKKLPPDVLEWFRKQGAKGGKLGGPVGGKIAAADMTKEERVARAKKATAAAVIARKANRKPAE
jgi:hypothetical protein